MNEILSEIKPDIIEKGTNPYFKWIVLGTIIVVVCIIIYITFFSKSKDEVQEKKDTAVKDPPLPEIEEKKEIKKEIFGPEKPTTEEVKKLNDDFKEESSEEVDN